MIHRKDMHRLEVENTGITLYSVNQSILPVWRSRVLAFSLNEGRLPDQYECVRMIMQ